MAYNKSFGFDSLSRLVRSHFMGLRLRGRGRGDNMDNTLWGVSKYVHPLAL